MGICETSIPHTRAIIVKFDFSYTYYVNLYFLAKNNFLIIQKHDLDLKNFKNTLLFYYLNSIITDFNYYHMKYDKKI